MGSSLKKVRILKTADKAKLMKTPIADLIDYKKKFMNKHDYWMAMRVAMIIIELRNRGEDI